MSQYKHRKNKELYTLDRISGVYYYMRHDGVVTVYGKKVFKELFEWVIDD